MKANIGLTEKNSQAIAQKLNTILADEFLLALKTRNYHWNIEGPNFMEMHKFYEGLYNELDEIIDEVAERVRTLGHYTEGRMADYLKLTNLQEEGYSNDQNKQLKSLLDDHETMVRQLRKDVDLMQEKYKDAGNADFLTGLMEKHEKWAWFIRSYLK
ncbi:DNA starvation/stationary phase protection protein [Panacibacter sp. DH6]|uniref:DNA starvation/stationary phase protection protein n=1 Tax=Panacibacter microcysteis TaxID=2793269 RepID=A0A931MDE4_9BACT|nr:Dps family protein [Panacibacter microcysteis]MBG9378636.1 DNA starvation/stationary phase protection protein [Panacibacter microcysteis]